MRVLALTLQPDINETNQIDFPIGFNPGKPIWALQRLTIFDKQGG